MLVSEGVDETLLIVYFQKQTTLMVFGIPQQDVTEDDVRKHFDEAYPNAKLVQVDFSYDVSDMEGLIKERWVVEPFEEQKQSYFPPTDQSSIPL